jgi:hypothetical protein
MGWPAKLPARGTPDGCRQDVRTARAARETDEAGRQTMNDRDRNPEVRIRWVRTVRGPELEVTVPLREQVTFRIWSVLDLHRIRPVTPVLVNAGERLIVRAKLIPIDGSPLTQQRVARVLDALRSALARPRASQLGSDLAHTRQPPGRQG